MSQWEAKDGVTGVPTWAPTSVKQAATANNVAALYKNTTANTAIPGVTVAVNVVGAEGSNTAGTKGWVLTTKGSGGRAGRTQTEVLVALTGTIEAAANTANT